MKLFEIVPGNFFSILSSGNREIYCDALMLLHDAFKTELNIRAEDYRSSLISMLEDKAFEVEDDEEMTEGSLTLSSKASIVLNKLIRTGWIEKEYIENSFVEILTPKSYAIPVMKLLSELSDNSLLEYNSLVFATFSGLKQAANPENSDQMYEAILSAKNNTEQLQYLLRTFYHSVRGYLNELVDQHDVNTLLQNHFGAFTELSDRIYHPIKTMDSFYRYQNPIQSLLADIYANDSVIDTMRQRAMAIKKYNAAEDADKEIFAAIDYVMEAYRNLGNMINEIDRKKSTYTKNTSEKIRYLTSADQTIKGKLAELLKLYANSGNGGKEQLIIVFNRNINANRQEVFDAKALYHRKILNRRIDTEPLTINQDMPAKLLSEDYLLEQIKNAFPTKRILAFVNGLFAKGESTITTKDLHIENDTDFILLILAVIRQNDGGMNYSIETSDKREYCNGYMIPDMVIKRGAVRHVE